MPAREERCVTEYVEKSHTRTEAPSLHSVGGIYKAACAWHAGAEVHLEIRQVPPPPYYTAVLRAHVQMGKT